jgi:hypothetical protein
MSAARGDRKPCTYTDCGGTMQFSRYACRPTSLEASTKSSTPTARARPEEPGWVCDLDRMHFQSPDFRVP